MPVERTLLISRLQADRRRLAYRPAHAAFEDALGGAREPALSHVANGRNGIQIAVRGAVEFRPAVQAAADEPRVVVDGGGGERRGQQCQEQGSDGAPLYHDPEKLALRLAMKAAMPSRASRVRAWSAMPCASSSIWV